MKILVMGGTRFVGKSLVGKLLKQNHNIDIFTRGNKINPERTNLIKGDRNSSEDIIKLRNKKYDVVYDISGRELKQTKLLIENLADSFQRYIYVSSAGVYKDIDELPLSENDPVDPDSRHIGKFETENWLINQKIPFTSFRPTYIYGPGNYNKIENWFFERLFTNRTIPVPGDGSLITQLGHVSDLTDAMIKCINFENSKSNIYNCSGEKGVTIKGLIYICAEVLGLNKNEISLRRFDYQKLDPKSRKGFPIRLNHYQTDISKIKNDLEWKPNFDLLHGLKDSFEKDFNFKKGESFDDKSDKILFNS
ncbi:NAD-dependent epimerase/dehydratase family protein [uncultured Prochlorococcus sp.]|uniref:NAD-dependent epimerase/dehydratase family protein n=1 Tax=uncultured Prochlorococcus sp. TaxID=159733 RepID=UPI002585BFC5|nr:NAD-dependent epimerase/dehydratase family protein [uncultured Prochlorococcus sp.]